MRPFSPGVAGRGALSVPRSVLRQRSSEIRRQESGRGSQRARGRLLVFASRAKGQFFADAGARDDWRIAGQSVMIEDFSHDDAIADHLVACSAARALEHVDGKDSLQQLGPCQASCLRAALCVGVMRGCAVSGRCTIRCSLARSRHDQVAIGRRGCEDTLIGVLMSARPRHGSRQPLDESQRVKRHRRAQRLRCAAPRKRRVINAGGSPGTGSYANDEMRVVARRRVVREGEAGAGRDDFRG